MVSEYSKLSFIAKYISPASVNIGSNFEIARILRELIVQLNKHHESGVIRFLFLPLDEVNDERICLLEYEKQTCTKTDSPVGDDSCAYIIIFEIAKPAQTDIGEFVLGAFEYFLDVDVALERINILYMKQSKHRVEHAVQQLDLLRFPEAVAINVILCDAAHVRRVFVYLHIIKRMNANVGIKVEVGTCRCDVTIRLIEKAFLDIAYIEFALEAPAVLICLHAFNDFAMKFSDSIVFFDMRFSVKHKSAHICQEVHHGFLVGVAAIHGAGRRVLFWLAVVGVG